MCLWSANSDGAKNGGWKVEKPLHMQVFNAGAGVYATARDVLRYLDTLHRGNLLSARSKTQMFSPDSPYAWQIETLSLGSGKDKQVHSFDGQLKGYSSLVYQVLDDDLSVVLLANTGMGFEHKRAMADDILNAYYGTSATDKSDFPSLLLNSSLLDNTWTKTLSTLNSKPVEDISIAILLNDLARQLDWSGHPTKAIDLYAWLMESYPDSQGVQQRLVNLCEQHPDYLTCQPKKTLNVGMKVLSLTDPARKAWRSDAPRPVTTHLFYPTVDRDSENFMLGPQEAPLFHAGTVVKAGKPLSGKRPLVLMSHGTGGSAPQMLWLASALVKKGYLVAAINHHGNTALEAKKFPEGFLLWWERARDLAVVQHQLLNNSSWQGLIDHQRIAVVGFSLGGYTTLSALGGITDKALFHEFCEKAQDDFSCQPQPEFRDVLNAFEQVKSNKQVADSLARQHDNYRIANLKAAAVIAPAIVHTFEPDSLATIKTPTLFVVGSKDNIAPSKPNSHYADALLPNSQLQTIENAHHYSFLSVCTERGKTVLAELCDSPYGLTRHDAHQQAIEHIVTFLAKHLE